MLADILIQVVVGFIRWFVRFPKICTFCSLTGEELATMGNTSERPSQIRKKQLRSLKRYLDRKLEINGRILKGTTQ